MAEFVEIGGGRPSRVIAEVDALEPGGAASAAPVPVPSRRSETLFLMGNGPSLGRLTDREKEIIRAGDSLAMNVYARHVDEIGIAPDHFVQLDYDDVTREVMSDLPALVAAPSMSDTTFWLSPYWYDACRAVRDRAVVTDVTWPNLGIPLGFHKRIWEPSKLVRNYHVILDRLERRGEVAFTYGRLCYYWGWTPSDRVFRLNGTLTAALNIAWRLGYREVQLVGVDLNDGLHFHATDERLIRRDSDQHKINAAQQHATTSWSTDRLVPPVTEILSRIEKLFRRTGRRLYISNPDSVPAREGIVPYRPLAAAAAIRR